MGEVLRKLGEDARLPDRKQLVEQVQSAIQSAVPKDDEKKSWIAWELKAQRESDPDKREQIYREGIQLFPRRTTLHAAFAHFSYSIKNYDEAEELYRKALELDPESPDLIRYLAVLLSNVGRNHDEVEKLYRKAVELDPKNSTLMGYYAEFSYLVRNDNDGAARLFLKAIELDPENASAVGSYAAFLHNALGDYIKPNDLYRRAMELDPTDAFSPTNFTAYLIERGELKEAGEMSDRAWSLCVGSKRDRKATQTAMFRGLLLCFADKNDTPALGRLQGLFDRGFLRIPRPYASLFTTVDERLSEENRNLYHAISDAIQDEEKVAALDEFPRWKKVKPIPLDEPWPPLVEQD